MISRIVGEATGVVCATVDADEIALPDRMAMEDLLTRYATAVDNRNWDLLDSVFTHNAHLDYRSAGGVEGSYPEVRQWLSEVLPIFDVTHQLKVDGKLWLFTVGGRYHDRLVETTDGWRIARRIEHTLWWDHPMPGLPEVPQPVPGLPDR
jgi:hypothetical protein